MKQWNHRATIAGIFVLTVIVAVTPAWSRGVTSAGCEGPTRIPLVTPSPIPSPKSSYNAPALQRLTTAPKDLGFDGTLFGLNNDRSALLKSIDRSLNYLQTDAADRAYANYPIVGVTRGRVLRSLRRFRILAQTSKTPEQLQQRVIQEFDFYESSGKDGNGIVDFTGYFEPVYAASRRPDATFRYPLYRQPSGFLNWPKPHPTRSELEGNDGLSAQQGKLKGTELVWMNNRLQAFLVQVQGSARLSLTDGTTMAIGFDGNTDYPYVGIGRELVKDGKFKLDQLTLPKILQYFQDNPADLDTYLPRNDRFVFFRNTQGALATGSLGLPVTANRSIATDKKKMPPGALALIDTELPNNELTPERVGQFVLDQDTGGAIVGPGRVDVFMGTGDRAKAKAGLVRSIGKLYYLLLK